LQQTIFESEDISPVGNQLGSHDPTQIRHSQESNELLAILATSGQKSGIRMAQRHLPSAAGADPAGAAAPSATPWAALSSD